MKQFLKTVFCESDGMGSWARTASLISLLAAIAWVTRIVLKTHAIPSLDGVTGFISAPYLINKTHDGVTSIMGRKQ